MHTSPSIAMYQNVHTLYTVKTSKLFGYYSCITILYVLNLVVVNILWEAKGYMSMSGVAGILSRQVMTSYSIMHGATLSVN